MTTRILDRRAVTFGLAGALCMPSILRAQTNYPELGQMLVIENVAGAGGTIGSTRAALPSYG